MYFDLCSNTIIICLFYTHSLFILVILPLVSISHFNPISKLKTHCAYSVHSWFHPVSCVHASILLHPSSTSYLWSHTALLILVKATISHPYICSIRASRLAKIVHSWLQTLQLFWPYLSPWWCLLHLLPVCSPQGRPVAR